MSGSGFNLGDFNPANMGFGNMPNISMINLSDLQGMLPKSQQIKKKKPKEKKEKPALDIRAIPLSLIHISPILQRKTFPTET